MRVIVSAIFCLLHLGVSGCASSGSPIASDVEFLDFPKVGVVTSANLGDTMLVKGLLRTFPTITTFEPIKATAYAVDPHVVPAQTFILTGLTGDFRIYSGAKHTLCESVSGQSWRAAPLHAMEGACAFPVTAEVSVKRGKVQDVKAPSFRQELIYNGKSGSSVRFLYRELTNDFMRPAFTQEIVYDLDESSVIGFKEVRIEVIAANNTTIDYKVLEHFE
jgi:hypothetical protein